MQVLKNIVFGLFVLTLFCPFTLFSQLNPIVDSIPMSDGKKLAVDIYIPAGTTKASVILIQTPYNRQIMRFTGLPMGYGMNVDSCPYVFVVSDWRGFYGSKNSMYIGSPDRGTDGYQTVEWIANQTWSNGKIGTWGPSALGKIQFQTAIKNPPHLICICPSVAAPQFEFNEYYPNGVLRTEYIEQLDQLGFGLSQTVLAHPYQDATWNFISKANDYADSINVPAFLVGGWYDHNIELMLNCFNKMLDGPMLNVRNKHKLLVGPWVHGGHGSARVGSINQGELTYANAQNKNDSMSRAFFDFYLRGIQNGWDNLPVMTYYNMGENKWKSSDKWPIAQVFSQKMYLNFDNSLSSNMPNSSQDSLIFEYDPQDPSPTIGGCTLRADLVQGPYNQKTAVESRQDVLLFTTKKLLLPLNLNGNIKVNLWVSSDQLDTDFDIRLTDVYPDGKSMLINDAAYRMRYRNGFTQAQTQMMNLGTKYLISIVLPASVITILPNHQLRLIISSSNYPKYNRNMNNGNAMYPGNSTDTLLNPNIAKNVIYVNSIHASSIELPLATNSSVSSVNSNRNQLRIYPNPSSAFINVQHTFDKKASLSYSVIDMKGKVVQSGELNGETINLEGLNSGLYTLKLGNGIQEYTQIFVLSN